MALQATRLLRFAGAGHTYTFPPEQQAYRDNFADLVSRTTRIPGVRGGYDERGDDPFESAIGDISVQFRVWANTRADMTALRDEIKAMADWGSQKLYMQPSNPTLPERWVDAKITNISLPEERHNQTDWVQPVSMNFQAAFPFWHERGTESPLWGDGTLWGGGEKFGGDATPEACSGLQTDFTVNIDGSATTKPRITIQCGAGQTCTNPEIQRVAQGVVLDRVRIPVTLVEGDRYEINCRALSFKKNNLDAYTSSVHFDRAEIIRLPVGTNTIRVKFDNPGDAADVTLRWYTLWR